LSIGTTGDQKCPYRLAISEMIILPRSLLLLVPLLLVAFTSLNGCSYVTAAPERAARNLAGRVIQTAFVDKDVGALSRVSSPEMLRSTSPGHFRKILAYFSTYCGALVSYNMSPGIQQNIFSVTNFHILKRAEFEVAARCTHHPIAIDILLSNDTGMWQLLGLHFNVNLMPLQR